jgi:hypothetical protein
MRLVVGYALALVVVACAVRYVGVQAVPFLEAMAQIPVGRLLVSLCLFLLALFINAFAFALANRAFGVALSGHVVSGAWLSTLLAKYVPVGVGHVFGRGVVLSGYGVAVRTTAMVGLLEQVVSLALCASIALVAFAYLSGALSVGTASFFLPIAVVAATMVAMYRKRIDIRVGALTASLACYGAAMLPYAMGYLILVDPAEPLRFIRALFAGTVAGVLAVFVPGGLGVRESAVVALSGGRVEIVLAGTIAARALILVSEILASFFGHWLLRRASIRS